MSDHPPTPFHSVIGEGSGAPLELGGSNAIVNLFPESGSGLADYHVKDRLENRIHAMVCTGSISLQAAQTGIARDWEAIYRRVFGIPPTR